MKIRSIAFSALLTASIALPASVVTCAARQQSQQQSQQQDQQPADPTQSPSNSFSGKITKSDDGKFVLQDATKSSMYALDNQKLAKKFAGKNVVVTGTLDASNNLIHVEKIEASA